MSGSATAETSASVSNRPIAKTQLGNICVRFPARSADRERQQGHRQELRLAEMWKDKDGNWQDQSISLSARDILAVQQALTLAFVESFGKLSDDEE